MKLKAIFLFFMLFLSNGSLTEIRDLYSKVTDSNAKQKDFIEYMQKVAASKPVFQAYKGASLVLQSKNTTDRKSKKDFFVQGAELIEDAVRKDSENIEIRLVRLSVQENIPKALKYSSNIQEDVALIRKFMDTTKDSELKLYVQQYVMQSKSFK